MSPRAETRTTCRCGGAFVWAPYCGVYVCEECDRHRGLARCYCGWSSYGGDGRQQLEQMGEQIEEDY